VRKLRRFLNLVVPAVGMALVLGAVLFGERLVVQLFLVVAGLMLTEAGFWRLADPILPDERRYVALRAETDHFTALVRQLNAAALALAQGDERGSLFALEEVRTQMHRSVDRMVEFAGRGVGDIPADQAGVHGPGPGPARRTSSDTGAS
jgi:hypothetical protein